MRLSSHSAEGLEEFWQAVQEFYALQRVNGCLEQRRQRQALAWMWERIDAGLKAAFRAHPRVRSALPDTTTQVQHGLLAPSTAARHLLALATGSTT